MEKTTWEGFCEDFFLKVSLSPGNVDRTCADKSDFALFLLPFTVKRNKNNTKFPNINKLCQKLHPNLGVSAKTGRKYPKSQPNNHVNGLKAKFAQKYVRKGV